MTRTLTIAITTVREAARERLMWNLAIFAIVLTGGSLTISQLTLGEQSRIIADVGTSSTQVFGTLIAVFVGVGLVAKDLDRRTCYALLARPLSRAEFIAGKYLGLIATLVINAGAMALATAAVLALYSGGLGFLGLGYLGAYLLLLVQFSIAGAFAVFFASFTTATLATIFTLSLVAAGHVFSEVRSFWLTHPSVEMKQLVTVLDVLLPNMGLLDLKEAVTYGDPVRAALLLPRLAYGLGYAAVVVFLGAVVFSRRDVR
jgi:ABC-type transport system involved in multi-copper enzyme maturation permease subunit